MSITKGQKAYKLLYNTHAMLRKRCERVEFPINKSHKECIEECKKTIKNVEGFYQDSATYISAPQVGYLYRIMIIADQEYWYSENMSEKLDVYINPKIVNTSKEEVLCWEACLSDIQKMALVKRPSKIDFEYYDENGSYFL